MREDGGEEEKGEEPGNGKREKRKDTCKRKRGRE